MKPSTSVTLRTANASSGLIRGEVAVGRVLVLLPFVASLVGAAVLAAPATLRPNEVRQRLPVRDEDPMRSFSPLEATPALAEVEDDDTEEGPEGGTASGPSYRLLSGALALPLATPPAHFCIAGPQAAWLAGPSRWLVRARAGQGPPLRA